MSPTENSIANTSSSASAHANERITWAELNALQTHLADIGDSRTLDDVTDGLAPSTIGRFKIISCIGRGNSGSVYLACDSRLSRKVAIKVAHPGLQSKPLQARFVAEAHAAARLTHPNVVCLYEYGEDDGMLYLVYEMCEGSTLEEWLTEQPDRLPFRTAVAIVRELASGLAHAHSRGLIHRDVKPGNILLQPNLELGNVLGFIPRITDFGLAHDILEQETSGCGGRFVGTIDYMSPEQIQGDTQNIQPASDQYALGVLLYRMLTGVLPFASDDLVQTLQAACGQSPPELRSIQSSIPRDLEAICHKCLEKKPEDRYATCRELVRDLDRFANGLPVSARPLTKCQLGWRIVCKAPLVSALVAAIFGVCLVSALMFSQLASNLASRQIELQSTLADLNRSQATALRSQEATYEMMQLVDMQKSEAEKQTGEAVRVWYHAELHRAYGEWERQRVLSVSNILSKVHEGIRGHLEPGMELRLLSARSKSVIVPMSGHAGPTTEVEEIGGTDLIVTAGQDGKVSFHNTVTGYLEHSVTPQIGFEIHAMDVSGDGTQIAIGYVNPLLGLSHARVHQIDYASSSNWLHDSQVVHFSATTIESLRFSPCSKLLSVGSRYKNIVIYSLEKNRIMAYFDSDNRNHTAPFSPDGRHVLVMQRASRIDVLSAQSGGLAKLIQCENSPQFALWSPCGKWIARVGYQDEFVQLESLDDPAQSLKLTQPHGGIRSIAFSTDGSRLVAGTHRGAVVAWELGILEAAPPKSIVEHFHAAVLHTGSVSDVAMIGKERVASVSDSGSVVVSELPTEARAWLSSDVVVAKYFEAKDVEGIFLGHSDGSLTCREFHEHALTRAATVRECELTLMPSQTSPVSALCLSPNGMSLGIGWRDGQVGMLDITSKRFTKCDYSTPVDSLEERKINDLCFSANSKLLAACGDDARARVWTVAEPSKPQWEHTLRSMAYSSCFDNQDRLAVGGMFEEIVLFRGRDGHIIRRISGATRTGCLVFDDQRQRFISGHADGRLRVYGSQDLTLLATLGGSEGEITSLTISPTRDCYLSGDSSGHLKVWNAAECTLTGTLLNLGPTRGIRSLEIEPSQQTLAVLYSGLNPTGAQCIGIQELSFKP